jgi:hypothetical protein
MPLTVTVEANESFPANEAVTLAKLRNAAKPSVAISGSVGADDLTNNSVKQSYIQNDAVSLDKLAHFTSSGSTQGRGYIITSGSGSDGAPVELYAGGTKAIMAGDNSNNLVSRTLQEWDSGARTGSMVSLVDLNSNANFGLTVNANAITSTELADNAVGNDNIAATSIVAGTNSDASVIGKIANQAGAKSGVLAFDGSDSGKMKELIEPAQYQVLAGNGPSAEMGWRYINKVLGPINLVDAANTEYSAAHGLPSGVKPTMVDIFLECVTGEQGYVAGQRIYGASSCFMNENAFFRTWLDGDNVKFETNHSKPYVYRDDANGVASLLVANWKLYFVVSA